MESVMAMSCSPDVMMSDVFIGQILSVVSPAGGWPRDGSIAPEESIADHRGVPEFDLRFR